MVGEKSGNDGIISGREIGFYFVSICICTQVEHELWELKASKREVKKHNMSKNTSRVKNTFSLVQRNNNMITTTSDSLTNQPCIPTQYIYAQYNIISNECISLLVLCTFCYTDVGLYTFFSSLVHTTHTHYYPFLKWEGNGQSSIFYVA